MALINAQSAAADLEREAIKILAAADRLFLPVIAVGEYKVGTTQSRHRSAYQNWLQEWTAAVSVLNVDEETTFSYAEIVLELRRKGKPRTNDLWIAALCRQHRLPLLSRMRQDWRTVPEYFLPRGEHPPSRLFTNFR